MMSLSSMSRAVLALLGSAFAATAFAAAPTPYVGLSLGATRTGSIGLGSTLTKRSDVVAGIFGGVDLSPQFGVEAFYTGAGKFDVTVGNVAGNGKVDVFGIDAVGHLPLWNGVSLYGKIGVARAKTTASGALGGAQRSAATYGLGVDVDAGSNVVLRAGWDRYGAAATAGAATQDFNADVFSVGAVYKFN